MFSWKAFFVTLVLWWVSGSLGIGMGFHRLLTHRGYKTPKAVEYFLTFCGALALEGGAINWVATHRIHHAHTDAEGDPHTPRDGRWWAHMGWILRGTAQQHEPAVLQRYAPDLMKDPVHVWMNRLYFVPLFFPVSHCSRGGLGVCLWQCPTRHGRFAFHLASQSRDTLGERAVSRPRRFHEQWWVALLHSVRAGTKSSRAPARRRHGLAWYEIDFNWYGIKALQLRGWRGESDSSAKNRCGRENRVARAAEAA